MVSLTINASTKKSLIFIVFSSNSSLVFGYIGLLYAEKLQIRKFGESRTSPGEGTTIVDLPLMLIM